MPAYQNLFFLVCQPFDLRFTVAGKCIGYILFIKNQFDWSPCPGVLRTANKLTVMFEQASRQMIRFTSVITAVCTFDNVGVVNRRSYIYNNSSILLLVLGC